MIRSSAIKFCFPILTCLLLYSVKGLAQQNRQPKDNSTGIFHTDIPHQAYTVILGRPTTHSITISIQANEKLTGYIQYGLNAVNPESTTRSFDFAKGDVRHIEIDNLQSGKKYFYRFRYQTATNGPPASPELNFFHTPRVVNDPFAFTVQADSHLDENAGPAMYVQTLKNMAADSADFLVDLGDTWMTDKYRNDYKESLKQYIAQRYYFGMVCKSSHLFLTLGNHDGESGQQLKKNHIDNMTNWATATRKNYYPNPFPNDFYSGNHQKEADKGYPENYYAWEWGNALFIVLDPFRYTPGGNDPWQRTLGAEQYNWLKNSLQKTKAVFKFVFIHNLVGGVDLKGKGRGGAEAAKYFEWGGQDTSSKNSFMVNRPGWEKPIHDLLVQYKVNIVFHGHDHLFAKQDLDGIIYQLVPQPGALRYGNTNSAAEYGYINGKIMNGPGYLRVKIDGNSATIDWVQTSIDPLHKNREIPFTYTIHPK